jgi:hypothetical protein
MYRYQMMPDSKNETLLKTIKNIQKNVHMCTELLPLISQFKNISNVMSLLDTFTKDK